jgi:hypothetical protein
VGDVDTHHDKSEIEKNKMCSGKLLEKGGKYRIQFRMISSQNGFEHSLLSKAVVMVRS